MLELYFNYRRVIARFRRGTLGNEIDHIAASLSRVGYKRLSAKLYLARIAHFSAYATGCSKSVAISSQIVDRYLKARPSVAAHWAAQSAIAHAARCFPERLPLDQPRRIPTARCWRGTWSTCKLFGDFIRRPARDAFWRRGGCWFGKESIFQVKI